MPKWIAVSERAVNEALRFETKTDRRLRERLRKEGLTEEWFLAFGRPNTGYGVARTLRRATRGDALRLIQDSLIRPLLSANSATPDPGLVDRVAAEVRDAEYTPLRRTPVSAVSKIAALTRPDVFVPYDSFARDTLAEAGYGKREPSYTIYHQNFLKAFNNAKSALVQRCASERTRELARDSGVDPAILRDDWFLRRMFDWELWLRGSRKKKARVDVSTTPAACVHTRVTRG